MPPVERLFENAESLVADLADEIADRLRRGIAERGQASFVATGGTTPGALYDRLSQADLPWDRVFITLSDERWVPTAEGASNERLVRERLLQGPASAARLTPLKTGDASPEAAEAKVDAAIRALPRPFDVVLLGMGADLHVASLFPGNPVLPRALAAHGEALACAAEVAQAAGASARMSLTVAALTDARAVILLVRGQDKLDAWRRALAGDDVNEAPVRAVIHQDRAPVEFYWAP